ncbi:MAG: hypothetical protein ABI977_01130 [Acidobacteriota bacterium]
MIKAKITKKARKAKTISESNNLSWRDFRFSDKKIARLKKLKEYFDTLDEETQICEFEKLSLEEMHYIAASSLAEEVRKGTRLT